MKIGREKEGQAGLGPPYCSGSSFFLILRSYNWLGLRQYQETARERKLPESLTNVQSTGETKN